MVPPELNRSAPAWSWSTNGSLQTAASANRRSPSSASTPAASRLVIQYLGGEAARLKTCDADVVIGPKVGDASSFDFARKKELMAAGVAAARDAVPTIRAAIERAARRPVSVSSHGP